MKIKPKCDMLIAQNVFMDGNPVGHSCYNDADFQTETHFLCKSCRERLKDNLHCDPLEKITIPQIGSVIGWEERTRETINRLMKGMG